MAVKEDANKAPDPSKQWQEEVGALYDLVSTVPRVTFQEAGFVPVLPEPVLRVQRDAGLSIFGYLHIVDTDSIRHIIKNHSSYREVLRGQLPIVRQNFLLLPEVFGRPAVVENGGKTKPGRDTVRYSKTIGGVSYYYTEELRTKKNRLAAVTFYKRKN